MRQFITTAAIALALSAPSLASDLIANSKTARSAEAQHGNAREMEHRQEADALAAKLISAQDQLTALKAQIAELSANFSANEKSLSEKETELTLASGAMGEVYGVVRQVGGELTTEFERGPLALIAPERIEQAKRLASTEKLPELAQLQSLPSMMLADIADSRQISLHTLSVAQTDGQLAESQVWRIGPFNLLTSQGFVQVDSARALASLYPRQPEFTLPDQSPALVIDPAMGDLVTQYQQTPTLQERLEHGGVVGSVILGLLAFGLLIALIRGSVLLSSSFGIRRQLKSDQIKTSNPLGRILSVYHAQKHHNLDTLELKLLEAIVNEQQGLEKGLSMLKLLAAIAPMLGLLGTVTGMIETFQVITQYGNGDPKVMAGGISTALITTVLGLVAAMPLLLAHNVLATKVTTIRSFLEKESIALVAAHADEQSNTTQPTQGIAA